MRQFVLFVAGLFLAIPLGAQTHVILPPKPTGYVTDVAHLLRPAVVDSLAAEIAALRKSTGANLAVATLPSTLADDPMDVAMKIGRTWGVADTGSIGSANRNLGAVLLVTPRTGSDKIHCRIATARGAEGVLTDADAGDICRTSMPYFQKGDYSTGVTMAVRAIDERLRRSGAVVASSASGVTPGPSTVDVLEVVGGIIVVIVAILSLCGVFSQGGEEDAQSADLPVGSGLGGSGLGGSSRSSDSGDAPPRQGGRSSGLGLATEASLASSLSDDDSASFKEDDDSSSSSSSDSFGGFDGGSGGGSGFSGGGGGADG